MKPVRYYYEKKGWVSINKRIAFKRDVVPGFHDSWIQGFECPDGNTGYQE